VLPSAVDRYCFTIWLSGATDPGVTAEERNAIRAVLSGAESNTLGRLGNRCVQHAQPPLFCPLTAYLLVADAATAWKLLHHPALRTFATKWLYREEWAQSLIESHPPTPDRDQMVNTFWKEVGVIQAALRPLLPVLQQAATIM
jgi:hypothetical protein